MLRYWNNFIRNPPTPSKSGYEFKMQHSFEKRKEETTRLKEKYPDKIPIILEKSTSSGLPDVKKEKYLLQKEITIAQFLYAIRQELKLDSSMALFLFINNSVIPSTIETLGEVYEKNRDKDGFLYITYCKEQTFG
jgi:GABA(A) receptor-associated protein